MGFKWLKSKKNPAEEADEVKVEVDLLTGATRFDLRSKATRTLLEKVKCVEDRIRQEQAG